MIKAGRESWGGESDVQVVAEGTPQPLERQKCAVSAKVTA